MKLTPNRLAVIAIGTTLSIGLGGLSASATVITLNDVGEYEVVAGTINPETTESPLTSEDKTDAPVPPESSQGVKPIQIEFLDDDTPVTLQAIPANTTTNLASGQALKAYTVDDYNALLQLSPNADVTPLDATAVVEITTTPKTAYRPNSPVAQMDLISGLIDEAALRYATLDKDLIHAVISAESNYDPLAVSNKGAMGLMQLMPATAKRHGVTNAFDPTQNIPAGTAELDYLIRNNKTLAHALAAYNAGQGAVDKYKGIPPFAETQSYVVKILTQILDKQSERLRKFESDIVSVDVELFDNANRGSSILVK